MLIFFLAALIGGIFIYLIAVVLFDIQIGQLGNLQIAPMHFINAGIVGLIIYELLYRTRKWLNGKTLILYILIAIPISSWVFALLNAVWTGYYRYAVSLAPLTSLFSAEQYPLILLDFLQTAIITTIAYRMIRTDKI